VLLWEKLHDPLPHVSGKVMVCGHTKQNSGVPLNLGHAVCIDTGVYEPDGWLTCLDVRTGQYWQANQRGQTLTSRLEEPPERQD
jgi:serine/threonine protein phosphatase 1